MAGYSRSSGIASKADARLRRATAAAARRTSLQGDPFKVDGGIVISANKAITADGRYLRDGLFIEYVYSGAEALTYTLTDAGHIAMSMLDPVLPRTVVTLLWDDDESEYVWNFHNTIVAQFTATTIICGTIYSDNGDFDFVRINASSGPALGIPGAGECVAYVQTSGGVDYLRVKFASGAVREIANSSHNLIQVDGIGIDGGIPSAGEIAFDAAGTIYSGGGELTGDLTLACYGVTGDIVLSPVVQVTANSPLKVDSDTFVLTTTKTPERHSSAGVVGQFAWDDSYLYVRVSTGWKRAVLFSVATPLAIDGAEISIDGTTVGVDQ